MCCRFDFECLCAGSIQIVNLIQTSASLCAPNSLRFNQSQNKARWCNHYDVITQEIKIIAHALDRFAPAQLNLLPNGTHRMWMWYELRCQNVKIFTIPKWNFVERWADAIQCTIAWDMRFTVSQIEDNIANRQMANTFFHILQLSMCIGLTRWT